MRRLQYVELYGKGLVNAPVETGLLQYFSLVTEMRLPGESNLVTMVRRTPSEGPGES